MKATTPQDISPDEIAMLHKLRALPPTAQDIVTELIESEYRKAAPHLITLARQELTHAPKE